MRTLSGSFVGIAWGLMLTRVTTNVFSWKASTLPEVNAEQGMGSTYEAQSVLQRRYGGWGEILEISHCPRSSMYRNFQAFMYTHFGLCKVSSIHGMPALIKRPIRGPGIVFR